MAPLAAKLTTAVMVDLNKQVEVGKDTVTDVARTWLQQNRWPIWPPISSTAS